jgi:DNA repair protein RecO (recombination protein O)
LQEKSHGIILRVTRLTDSSSIIRWWTLEHGLIETVAQGARRSKSPYAGKIDLFFTCEISWQRAKSGTLHQLREVRVEDYREGLRLSYASTLMAAYFCSWVEKIYEAEHADSEIYDLLTRGLNHLIEKAPTMRAMQFFERELARIHGVGDVTLPSVARLADMGVSMPSMREELLRRLTK